MSYSKRPHASAYQVYNSSSGYQKSERHNSHSLVSDMNRHSTNSGRSSELRKERASVRDNRGHREQSYDSDDEVLKNYNPAPKSLMASISSSKEHSSGRQKPFLSSSHRDKTGRGKHIETDRKPFARSLMDIDFTTRHDSVSTSRNTMNKWKDIPTHAFSSDEDSHEHLDRRNDWKGRRRFSKYSDSEEDDDGDFWHNNVNRSRRTWKDSTTVTNASNSSSRHAPLIVDLHEKTSNSVRRKMSGDTSQKPKPLLETYVPPPTKKPVSLLDLPSTGSSSELSFKRKPLTRPGQSLSGPDRKQSHDSKVSSTSRKRSASGDEHEAATKKQRLGKPKSDGKEKSGAVDSYKISVCKSGGHTFLVLPSSCSSLYLHGRAKITVLIGSVSILSCKLRIGTAYDVYSPASGSLLSLTCSDSSKVKADEVREELSKYNIPENDKDLEHIGNNTVAILLLDKLESTICDYVTGFIPYTQIFTAVPSRDIDQADLRGILLPKLGLKVAPLKEMVPACLNMSQEYEDILSKWTKKLTSGVEANKPQPVLLCLGAKNCGKSTFNRMLVNASLKSVSAVGYLDCDVGQTEFSPPATLSLHIIRHPVLGAPFCNQRHAERMVFYGETSPTHDPTLYVKCLKYIIEAYKELSPSVPLIVNTMGFPEGIGLMLMIDTINLVEPDLVVQIESFNQVANFPVITRELVALDEGWTCNKTPAKDPTQKLAETHDHELVQVPTLVSQRRDFSFKLKPVDVRNLTLLSALSMGLERGMTLTSLPPYTVPYKHMGVHICHHRLVGEDLLLAIDASVVALCVADLSQASQVNEDLPYVFESMPVCTCLGLGIVRGVDARRGLLYLVTTLPRVCLRKVNTILKGSLALPDQIIIKQKSLGDVPYLDALAPSTAVASVRPRTRMPRITLSANK